MKNIGCYKNLEDFPKERALLEEMWSCLSFRSNRKISVGDFKLFLMAIFAVKGNRRMGIENFEENIEDYNLSYGWINDEE
jgi:hypothetical protein